MSPSFLPPPFSFNLSRTGLAVVCVKSCPVDSNMQPGLGTTAQSRAGATGLVGEGRRPGQLEGEPGPADPD